MNHKTSKSKFWKDITHRTTKLEQKVKLLQVLAKADQTTFKEIMGIVKDLTTDVTNIQIKIENLEEKTRLQTGAIKHNHQIIKEQQTLLKAITVTIQTMFGEAYP